MTKGFKNFIRSVIFSIPAMVFTIVGIILWLLTLGHEKTIFRLVEKMLPEDEDTKTSKTASKNRPAKFTLITQGFKELWLFIWGVIVAVIFGTIAMALFIPTLGHSWKLIDYGSDYMDRLIEPSQQKKGDING